VLLVPSTRKAHSGYYRHGHNGGFVVIWPGPTGRIQVPIRGNMTARAPLAGFKFLFGRKGPKGAWVLSVSLTVTLRCPFHCKTAHWQ
jgi:hypothetical protein